MINFVNREDVLGLWRWAKRGKLERLVVMATSGRTDRVRAAWNDSSCTAKHWNEIPTILARWNRLMTGDPGTPHTTFVIERYLAGRRGLRMLSLGCGAGGVELMWAATGHFARIDGYDLASKRIDAARANAAAAGVGDICHFHVGDALQLQAAAEPYDVILFEHSLHHFSPLEQILVAVGQQLKPEGLLIANEFVGPTRFQWTSRQLEVINGLLALLPERYRRKVDGSVKTHVFRPSLLRMQLLDPSEAIESARIRPLLHALYEVQDYRPYGGTVLQMLLADIAQNFLDDTPETAAWLAMCCEVEDRLLTDGEMESDFALFVCRPKSTTVRPPLQAIGAHPS